MKFSCIATALLPLASAALFSKEEYVSGEVMSKMMVAKEVCDCHSVTHNIYLQTIAGCVGQQESPRLLRQQEVERMAQAQGQQGFNPLRERICSCR
jgi:hypothetical protein